MPINNAAIMPFEYIQLIRRIWMPLCTIAGLYWFKLPKHGAVSESWEHCAGL